MLKNETVIDLTQAAKLLPNRPHTSSLWRWARKGIGGIRLDYIRAGRRILTSVEAVDRFCRALAEADEVSPRSAHETATRTTHARPAQRQAAIDQAKRELEAAGFDS